MKTCVVTGATSGIGLAVALALAKAGYGVIGLGRSDISCARAAAQVRQARLGCPVEYFTADLMQQREVRRVAEELAEYIKKRCGGELYALINNAGCVRSWYATTEEGYEQQFALNHLAGFLLTEKLLPCLQRAGGRVIMTASGSHKGAKVHWKDVMLKDGYNPLRAYKQSKLCNLLFAFGLNHRLKARGITAYAVDPGLVNTDIGSKQTGGVVNFVWRLRKRQGADPSVPAQTYVYLCERDPAPTGLYYKLSTARKYSRQVNQVNADRLFSLSQRLCAIEYGE